MKSIKEIILEGYQLRSEEFDNLLHLEEKYPELNKRLLAYSRKNIKGKYVLIFANQDEKDKFLNYGLLTNEDNDRYLVDKKNYDKYYQYLSDVTNKDFLDDGEKVDKNFPIRKCEGFGQYVYMEFNNTMKSDNLISHAIFTGE